MKLTGKQLTIIVVAIAFIVMAIFTMVVGTEEDGKSSENTDQTEQTTKQDEDNKEKPDSVVVNEPLEGDPYKELDELIGLGAVTRHTPSYQRTPLRTTDRRLSQPC